MLDLKKEVILTMLNQLEQVEGSFFRVESILPASVALRFHSKPLEELSQEDILVNKQIMSDVRCLIKELPEDQMEVVKMRYFQQMSFKDIADKTGVSINTSLGRMRYALINLRKLITEKKLILTNSQINTIK